jgi:CxxC motif-containing protein (DUF1111 family)
LGGLILAAACDGGEMGQPIVLGEGAVPQNAGSGGGGSGEPLRPAIFSDLPVAGLSEEDNATFIDGDALFDTPFRQADGLGPLYTHQACSGCHDGGVRGPGFVLKMVTVEADGYTPKADQQLTLPYGNTAHPLTTGVSDPIVPPEGDPSIKVSRRMGPPVVGRGFLEAIRDDEIERVAAEQAASGGPVKGRINHVPYQSEPNPEVRFHRHKPGDQLIGRFGLKARIATLDDFSADAAQGDMGLTSPLRPDEFLNPAGAEDRKPGPDLTIGTINKMATYVRTLAIPGRGALDPKGPELFAGAGCATCHVPSLKTRADYPIAPLAGVDAQVYSDLLLHDMGPGLADGVAEFEAGPRDWRTTPLTGLRFNANFLHDGRAGTIEEAVEAHDSPGSEASESVARFRALSDAERKALVAFVGSL